MIVTEFQQSQCEFSDIDRIRFEGIDKNHGVLLVVDSKDQYSLDYIRGLREDMFRYTDYEDGQEPYAMILVAHKSDLSQDNSKAVELAKQMGIPCISTSCKSDKNVDEAFELLCKEITKIHPDFGHVSNKKQSRCWI